jgi:hypothetical protein
VNNIDQLVRDIEFQDMYTTSELARLKQFVEDSKKPLCPGSQKYSSLSGDLKLFMKIQRNPSTLVVRSTLAFLVISNFCSLGKVMVGLRKVSNNYWIR